MKLPKETKIGRFTLVPSPRPEDDKHPSYEDPEKKGEFMECDTCRTKTGTPALCRGCLHNRAVIERLR